MVRNHRSSEAPVVRNHRSSDSGAYFASSDEVVLDDGGSPGPFADPHAPSWTLASSVGSRSASAGRRSRGAAASRPRAVTPRATASRAERRRMANCRRRLPDALHGAGDRASLRRWRARARRPHALADPADDGLERHPHLLASDDRHRRGGRCARPHGIAELDGKVGGLRVLSMTCSHSPPARTIRARPRMR